MSTWASDDPVQLHAAPDAEFAGFAQGILREWNPDTFESTVDVRGGRLSNLPVASGVEALTYQPGNVLMLTRWKPRSEKGLASYWIGMGGRVVFPGPGAGAETVAWMRGALAKEISAEVFAERVHEAFVADSDTLVNQATFTDLDPAGPTITNVDVTFGVAIAFVGCSMAGSVAAGANAAGGFMGVAVAGATTIPADIAKSFAVNQTNNTAGGTNRTDGALACSALILPCNPGTHTFAAKYRTLDGPTTTVSFSQRSLVVIGI